MKVWCRLVQDNKIKRSELLELDAAELFPFVEEICQLCDLSRPVIVSKHNDEWTKFAHTAFMQEHFIDSFGYDRLEMEIVREKERGKK